MEVAIMKCRIRKSIIALGMIMALTDGMSITSFAAESNTGEAETPTVEYSIDMENSELSGATHVSSDTYIENGRMITVDVYELQDGTIITDTFERSAVAQFSKEGSDTVTRTRTISGWITINLTASFDWYTEGAFSYVRCSSMSTSRSNPDSKIVISKWDESYTSNYVSIGSAKASLEYYMYNSKNPTQNQSGTFTIKCTDTGSISDNG